MNPAPIALFAYNRPRHFRQAVESLLLNPLAAQSELHVFIDGPATRKTEGAVEQVRTYAKSINGFGAVTIKSSEENAGLAASVISGVTRLCRTHGQVIVVEDDLVVSPGFLGYMNHALDIYRDREQVMQISGYMFSADIDADADAVFLPFTTSWGWATWARAWRHFDPDMTGFERLNKDRLLRRQFNLGGAYDYFAMLQQQRRGEVDSWAIRWYLSVFLKNGLTLYPSHSLVINTGFDGSGTHGGGSGYRQQKSASDFVVELFPKEISACKNWKNASAALPRNRTGLRRILSRARTIAKRVLSPGRSA